MGGARRCVPGVFAMAGTAVDLEAADATQAKFIGTPKKVTTHVNQNEGLIFEKSSPGKKVYRLAQLDVPAIDAAAAALEAIHAKLTVAV